MRLPHDARDHGDVIRTGLREKGTIVWTYDAHGNLTRLGNDSLATTYANTYKDGRHVRITTSSANMSPPVVSPLREHDARGLLVRQTTGTGSAYHAVEQWTRDQRGVPLARSGLGRAEDDRCLAPLADRFPQR